ncbi:hypothetical protein KR009_001691 [Drosophila setifemur]|nr:hypothetical protein KR009_001691 [Drosophila setifemur]
MYRRCLICGQEPRDHCAYQRNQAETRRWQSLANLSSFNAEVEWSNRHSLDCSSNFDLMLESSTDVAGLRTRSTGGMPSLESSETRYRDTTDQRPSVLHPCGYPYPTNRVNNGKENQNVGATQRRSKCSGGPCPSSGACAIWRIPVPQFKQPNPTQQLKQQSTGPVVWRLNRNRSESPQQTRLQNSTPKGGSCKMSMKTGVNARTIVSARDSCECANCPYLSQIRSGKQKFTSDSNDLTGLASLEMSQQQQENPPVKQQQQHKNPPIGQQQQQRNPKMDQQQQQKNRPMEQQQQQINPPMEQQHQQRNPPMQAQGCQVCIFCQQKDKDVKCPAFQQKKFPDFQQMQGPAKKKSTTGMASLRSYQTTATNYCDCDSIVQPPQNPSKGLSPRKSISNYCYTGFAGTRTNNAVNVLLMPGSRQDDFDDSCCFPATFRKSAPAPQIVVKESDLTETNERAVFPEIDKPSYRVCRAATSDPKAIGQSEEENEGCANVLVLEEDNIMDCKPEASGEKDLAVWSINSSKEINRSVDQDPQLSNNWMDDQATSNCTKVLELQRARINELDNLLQQHNLLQQIIQTKVTQLQSTDPNSNEKP